MIKAYLKLEDDIMNIGSCDDGVGIVNYILDGNEQGDGLHLHLHQIPRIGERIFIGAVAIELEVLDIYHLVSVPFEHNQYLQNNQIVKLFCRAIPLKDWKRIY